MHRLVQMVVKDEMSEDDLTFTLVNIIEVFIHAFPIVTTNENRLLCRTYQGQIVEPLLQMKTICTSRSALIRMRVGEFLRHDGKYDDSEKLLSQAVENCTWVLGTENLDTLTAMHNLALTYGAQGRNVDAASIQEDVLEKEKRIMGEEHPRTLTAMHNLALTYPAQGRNVDAASIQEDVLEKKKRILGDEHLDTLATMDSLAITYQAQGRNADAASIQEEGLEKQKRILGDEHPC